MECPRCGGAHDGTVDECPECGLDLRKLRQYLRRSTCPKCGVSVDGRICPECDLDVAKLRRVVLPDDDGGDGSAERPDGERTRRPDDGGADGSGRSTGGSDAPTATERSGASTEPGPTSGSLSNTPEASGPTDGSRTRTSEAGDPPRSTREDREAGQDERPAANGGVAANPSGTEPPPSPDEPGAGPQPVQDEPGAGPPRASDHPDISAPGASPRSPPQPGPNSPPQAGAQEPASARGAQPAPTPREAAGAGQRSTYRDGLSQEEVYCIACGVIINRRAEVCPDCGTDQVPPGGWDDGRAGGGTVADYEAQKLARKSAVGNALLGFFLPPIAYLNLGKPVWAVMNFFTANFFLVGFLFVPIHAYSVVSSAKKRVRAGRV